MPSLAKTFVTKSYAKGTKMKKTNRVSPSARGEGSKVKPTAKRVAPSKRGESSTNTKATVAMKKNTAKVQEAGVANFPATVIKAANTISNYFGKSGKATPKTNSPSSNIKIIPSGTKVRKRMPPAKTIEEAARHRDLAAKRAKLIASKKGK
jgi:hypothetical protein